MLKLHWLVQSLWYQQDCSPKLSIWAIVAFVSKSSEAKYTERAESSLLVGLVFFVSGEAQSCFPLFLSPQAFIKVRLQQKAVICSSFTSQLCRALNIPCSKWCGSSKSSKGSGWKIFSIIAQRREAPRQHFAAVEVLRRARLAKCTRRMYTESGVGPLWLQTGKTSPPVRELPLWDTAPNTGVWGSESTADRRKTLGAACF